MKSDSPVKTLSAVNKGYAFLSYADEDRDFVKELKILLKKKKYAYWDYSDSDRDYRRQFSEELEQAIREAKATLSVISESWKKSNWAKKEYLFSEEVGVPVFLLKAKEIGPTLLTTGMTYIDFTAGIKKGSKLLKKNSKRTGYKTPYNKCISHGGIHCKFVV